MALTFFKTPRNKKFNYKPVYWDKTREEREKRMKTALEQSEDGKDYKDALRERMAMRWKRSAGARTRRDSNVRLVVILVVVSLVFYYIFFG